ncbi:hypothetical protein JTE90_026627 [Oedothorax gibbosus]|uniref:U4/U6.U5 tri-snRNP-associated protein 1 n=1 Tax=Oedothorax gibbosus TaxID=931172 RepID=A0AAV6U837_9ARAC|nr:hypothetical protein JTE90_026627 [Oedothorax gibbosus]
MGSSSKKHKEKKESSRKKHKRDRSRDRDGHKKSHKSSHRREKRKSPEHSDPEAESILNQGLTSHEEKPKTPELTPNVVEDDFDVDQLLDSKLSENAEFSSAVRRPPPKKRREEVIELLKRRQNQELSWEKPANNPDLAHGRNRSPTDGGVRIKEEPIDENRGGHGEPKLSLSVSETNKLRAKLGLKPLDVGKDPSSVSAQKEDPEIAKANKLREQLGLKPKEGAHSSGNSSHSSSESKKSRERSRPVPQPEPDFESENNEPQLSLSIAETNKLRAKLGLKPLDVGNESSSNDPEGEISKPAAEVFVKTENLSEKRKSEALREKLRVAKEKRAIEDKLKKTKGLADSDSEDESAATWVTKHQKMLQEKEAADKRAKLLEEMDAEFGIGALVEEEFDKKNAYTSQHLKGLTIAHEVDSFREGHQVILTLKDKGVLEEEEDVLENVNIVDNERYAKNVENKKKKPDYKAYEEPEYDEFGILKKKNMLAKYDEEIEGEKKKTFKIGNSSNAYMTKEQELELIRMKLKQQNEMSLEMPELKIANEYYTAEDMVQFKKPKKRRKVKKASMLKADDLLPEGQEEMDFGSRRKVRRRQIDPDDVGDVIVSTTGIPLIGEEVKVEMEIDNENEDQAEKELHSALNKARKLKERKIMATAPEKVMAILSSVGSDSMGDSKAAVNIEMNSVAEFCRTLGDIPTYGMSGNREEEAEDMMDLDNDLDEREQQDLESQNQGAWNEVDVEEKPAEILMRENEPILEEEPDITLGVAGALRMATKKGYLEKEDEKLSGSSRSSSLQAQSYTIEEKFYEDDKFGKRDRYTGPVQEFREKSNYKPDVKLEYIDDSGRLLTSKEAFRYLSHKFHGKGPGKNKVDKRMKKLDQDQRLKQMSSTDTPLNTVKLLQLKQKETQSPFIVLSGGNKTLTQTMISKTKH